MYNLTFIISVFNVRGGDTNIIEHPPKYCLSDCLAMMEAI